MHSYIYTCSYLMPKSYSILSLSKVIMIAGFLNLIPCLYFYCIYVLVSVNDICSVGFCVLKFLQSGIVCIFQFFLFFFFYFFWHMYVDTCSCSLFSLTAVWYSIVQYIKYVCLIVNGHYELCPFLLQCCSDHLYTFLCACISL